MKRIKKLAITLLMLTTAFTALAACKEEKTELVEAKLNTTQIVVGQDLNLSDGVLVYVENGENVEIALDSEDVTVSGYDKNKVGEQELTVTYKEQTITFKVTVLERISLTGAETEYKVGDKFNVNKGSLTIRNDDGTTSSVALNSDKVTVEGFDSSVAGTPTLIIRYKDGDVEYTTTLDVTVVGLDEVKLSRKPSTITYKSYETELDLSGGYLTVTVGEKKNYVYLTDNAVTVTGFDTSVVSAEEPTKKQTLKITYAGYTFDFEIEIQYSNVSLIKEIAAEYSELDWSGSEAPEITEEQGIAALEAANMYEALSKEEVKAVTEEETMSIIRVATVYAYDKWKVEAESFSNTFVVGSSSIILICEDYETTKTNLTKLEDENAQIYVYSDLLMNFVDDYSDEILYGETTLLQYVGALYTNNTYEIVTDVLAYMIKLYDTLDVPVAWSQETITDYATEIEATVDMIMNGDYTGYSYEFIHGLVSQWREKDDFFDIVYTYYYYGTEEQQAKIKDEFFQKIPLPGKLGDLYTAIANGYLRAKQFTDYPDKTLWSDTLQIFDSYDNIVALKEEFENEGTELQKAIYDLIDMEGFIAYNLVYVPNGYAAQAGELFGDDAFEALWKEYVALYDLGDVSGQIDFDNPETSEAFAKMFKSFVDASPSWQYGFIASMYNQYRESDRYTKDNLLALDYSSGYARSNFVYLYATYFMKQLSYKDGEETVAYEKAREICENLFIAIEQYALRYRFDTLEDFKITMDDIIDAYEELEGAEKTAFDNALGYCYEKYVTLYEMSKSNTPTDLGNWQPLFNELKDTLAFFYKIADEYTLKSEENAEEKKELSALIYATYEKIAVYAAQINACNDKNVLYAFYHEEFEIDAERTTTLEYGVWSARAKFIDVMGKFVIIDSETQESLGYVWDRYDVSDLRTLLVNLYDVMALTNNGGTLNSAKALAAMEAYRNATNDQLYMFYVLDCDKLYYAGLESFFASFTDEATKTLGTKLIAAEKAYAVMDEEDAEALEEFKTAMKEAIDAYEALTDKTEYDANLKAMYEFYLAKYTALNTAD